MKISYERDMRAKAKESKRPLVTIDVPGYSMQCIGDPELVQSLLRAGMEYHKRTKASPDDDGTTIPAATVS